jgi:hypothetical protein
VDFFNLKSVFLWISGIFFKMAIEKDKAIPAKAGIQLVKNNRRGRGFPLAGSGQAVPQRNGVILFWIVFLFKSGSEKHINRDCLWAADSHCNRAL